MHSVLVIKLVRAVKKNAPTMFHMASVLDLKILIGLLATIFIFIALFDSFKELTMYVRTVRACMTWGLFHKTLG